MRLLLILLMSGSAVAADLQVPRKSLRAPAGPVTIGRDAVPSPRPSPLQFAPLPTPHPEALAPLERSLCLVEESQFCNSAPESLLRACLVSRLDELSPTCRRILGR